MTKITETKIDTLIQDDRNLNKGTEQGKRLITKSLSEFGAGRSVLIDKNNRIIAGNKTHENAKEIGMEDVIVVETDGTKLVAVKRTDVDLDSKQGREMALADNATVKVDLEWDTDAMNDVAEDWGIEVGEWGVGIDDVSDVEKPKEDDFDEDEDNIEPTARRGDIFRLGEHRLMCGDSTDADAVAKLMNGERADLLFTDPPYGYEYQSNMRTKSEKFDVLKNDDKILDFFPLLPSFVDGWIFVCTTWKVLDMWTAIFKKQYDLTNLIVWDKGGGYIGDLRKTFGTDYEIIMCSNNGKELTGKRLGSVWSIGKDNAEKYDHPTQKPVALSGTAIDCTTKEGDIVLDLFGGSGSTMIACEQLGRKCRMMELDPHYCDVIIARWEKLTGQTAVKVDE